MAARDAGAIGLRPAGVLKSDLDCTSMGHALQALGLSAVIVLLTGCSEPPQKENPDLPWRIDLTPGQTLAVDYDIFKETLLASREFKIADSEEILLVLELEANATYWEETELQPMVRVDGREFNREVSIGNRTRVPGDSGQVHYRANYTWQWTHAMDFDAGSHVVSLYVRARHMNEGDYLHGAAPEVAQGFLRARAL